MTKPLRSLAGQVVAITGGARGIGRATAAALIFQGARVAIGDIDASLVERTAQQLGSGTVGLAVDVTEPESFENFLQQVETSLGPLDVLINNAGIMPVGPFIEETDATTQAMVEINVNGVIYGSRLALRRFLPRKRGHLVNISSIVGKAGTAGGASYCATKHAVVGLCEALRQELRDSGVDLSVVMPIGVNTELYSGVPQLRGMKTPEPEDVADAIVGALQTCRYEVYVPKQMVATVRLSALLPRRLAEPIGRLIRADRVLMAPNRSARAGYDARIARLVGDSEPESPEAARAQRQPV